MAGNSTAFGLMLNFLQYLLGTGSGVIVGFTLGLVGGGGSILAVPLMVYQCRQCRHRPRDGGLGLVDRLHDSVCAKRLAAESGEPSTASEGGRP
jgi:hypothetical protein